MSRHQQRLYLLFGQKNTLERREEIFDKFTSRNSPPMSLFEFCHFLFASFSRRHLAQNQMRSDVATNDIFHLFSTFLFSLSGQWERKIVLTKGFNPSRCSHIMSANFGGFQTPLVRFPNHYFWLMSQLGNLTRPPPPLPFVIFWLTPLPLCHPSSARSSSSSSTSS